MTDKNSLRNSSKWLVTNSFLFYFLNFAGGVVLARLLAPHDFGLLVTINIFTGIAGFLCGTGMSQALIQRKEVIYQHYQVVFTIQVLIGCFIYSIFFIAAPWFATWFDEPIYETLLRVSALTFIIRPFSNIPSAMMQRDMQFATLVKLGFFPLIISSGVSIAMAASGMHVWSLILGGFAGSLLQILLVCYKSGWRPQFSFDKSVAKLYANFGIKVSAGDILEHIRSQISNLFISRFYGPSLTGLYNKADSLSVLPSDLLSKPLYQGLFRALSIAQDNKTQALYIYKRTITLVLLYAMPCYVGLWWIAKDVVGVLYGEQWIAAKEPLQILAISGLFLSTLRPSLAVIGSQNKLGRALIIQTTGLIITAAAMAIALPHGLSAIAWAAVCSASFLAIGLAALALHVIQGKWHDIAVSCYPALLLNSILFATLYVLEKHILTPEINNNLIAHLLIMALVGGTTYTLCFLLFPPQGVKSEAERWKNLLRKIGNFR